MNQTPDSVDACPYVGLRPFTEDDAPRFFGREHQVDELLRRLGERRFVAVVGTSGSGKSSLVRAGLIPSLKKGYLPEVARRWRVAVMRPRNDPIGELAQALGSATAAASPSEVTAELRHSSLGLAQFARRALAPNEALLVVVDQFEEIFRFRKSGRSDEHYDDADAFIKLALSAIDRSELGIYLVLTMRSDYLGDCAVFRGLPEALNDAQYLVPALTRQQLHRVIEAPLAMSEHTVEPSLTQRLLNDVGYGLEQELDQLPVLQHVLMRTWQLASGSRSMSVKDYENAKSMTGALDDHAEEIFGSLDDEQRPVARKLFQRLCDIEAKGNDVRRPTLFEELAEVAADGDRVATRDVLRRFAAFLDLPQTDDWSDEATIDISHESLIREWNRLRGDWLAREAEAAKIYSRLHEDVGKNAKPWEDPGLSDALRIKEEQGWSESWGLRHVPETGAFAAVEDFLNRGVWRRRKQRAGLAMVLVVLAAAAVSVALWNAEKERGNELEQRVIAAQEEGQAIRLEAEAQTLRAVAEAAVRSETSREEAERAQRNAEEAEQEARAARARSEEARKEAESSHRFTEQQLQQITILEHELLRARESVTLRDQQIVQLQEQLARAEENGVLLASQLESQQNDAQTQEAIASFTETRRVEIVLTTAKSGRGGSTNDTITVAFSNQSAVSVSGPMQLVNLAEFSIPGRGNTEAGMETRYERTTHDVRFEDACYVRVVNFGTDGWAGESIEILVDGVEFLPKTSLHPRLGAEQDGGIEMFNRVDWDRKKYWEKQLRDECPP